MEKEDIIELKRLRKLGLTQSEVATKMGYSLRTIKRNDKAEIIDFPEQDNDFEDLEEGWVSAYSKELGTRTPDSASWNFIVYPESAPENWLDEMISWGCPMTVSMPHDQDTWKKDATTEADFPRRTEGIMIANVYSGIGRDGKENTYMYAEKFQRYEEGH